jgi:Domain of unknown function (DUF4375)
VPKLDFEVPDLVFARLTALAWARQQPIALIAMGALEAFAASGPCRREIRKARHKAGEASLADLGWIDGYTGQSLDELMSYAGSETPIALLLAIEQGIRQRIEREGINWTGVERTLLSVMALHQEVNNGGFDQFFRNSSLRYGQSIVADLKRIGATETASIAGKAVVALELSDLTPQSIRTRMSTPDEKRDGILHECDEAFYKLNEITLRLFTYLRENPNGIRL